MIYKDVPLSDSIFTLIVAVDVEPAVVPCEYLWLSVAQTENCQFNKKLSLLICNKKALV